MTSNELHISTRSLFLPGITPGCHMSMHAKNWVLRPYGLPVIEKCHVCNGQTHREQDRKRETQTDRPTDRQRSCETDLETVTPTDKQRDKRTDRQTDRQTER